MYLARSASKSGLKSYNRRRKYLVWLYLIAMPCHWHLLNNPEILVMCLTYVRSFESGKISCNIAIYNKNLCWIYCYLKIKVSKYYIFHNLLNFAQNVWQTQLYVTCQIRQLIIVQLTILYIPENALKNTLFCHCSIYSLQALSCNKRKIAVLLRKTTVVKHLPLVNYF